MITSICTVSAAPFCIVGRPANLSAIMTCTTTQGHLRHVRHGRVPATDRLAGNSHRRSPGATAGAGSAEPSSTQKKVLRRSGPYTTPTTPSPASREDPTGRERIRRCAASAASRARRTGAGARAAARRRTGAHHGQHPTGAAHAGQRPGRDRRGGRVACPRHRIERGDFSPCTGRSWRGRCRSPSPSGSSTSHFPGCNPGLGSATTGESATRCSVTDVPRPAARPDGLHRHRRAQGARRQCDLQRPHHQRARHVGLRSYFPVLGLPPVAGRLFGPEVDDSIGGHPMVVVSHDF